MATIDSVKLPDNSTYDLTDNYSGYQTETLATPITVDGTSETTVEGALGAVNDYADKIKGSMSNENLVDNPFFTVNERGNASFSSAGYTVDRWKKESSSGGTLTLTSDGMQFPASATGGNLEQPFEGGKFLNKTITVTLKYSDGTYVKGTTTFTGTTTMINDGKMRVFLYYDSILLQHSPDDATARTIRAVKLELGSISTLANDIAPDYALELAKCQTSTADPSDTFANQGQLMTSALQGVLGARNLNSLPYYESAKSESGITMTSDDKGIVTASGTASAVVALYMHSDTIQTNKLVLPKGDYTLSGCPVGGSQDTYCLRANFGGTQYYDVGSGVNFTLAADTQIEIAVIIKSGTALPVGGITIKPMIRIAEDTDETFQPYAMTNRQLTEETREKTLTVTAGTGVTINNSIFKQVGHLIAFLLDFTTASASNQYATIATIGGSLTTIIPNYYNVISSTGAKTNYMLFVDANGNIGVGADGLPAGSYLVFGFAFVQ